MNDLKFENCINEICPWSGNSISPEALTIYKNKVVGFCKIECRDNFEKAIKHFDNAIESNQ